MYRLEDRMRAVNLYLKWGRNSAAVRRELGYPSKKALRLWVKEYEIAGSLTMDTTPANRGIPRSKSRLR